MIITISGIALLVLGLLALLLQRLYSAIPAKELKRLAQRGDHLAKALYRPVAYGTSLRVFLWTVVGTSLSVGLLILLRQVPVYVGFIILAVLMAVTFVWVPTAQLTVRKAQLAAALAPAVVKLLYYLHGPLDRVVHFVGHYRELTPHSRMYEKQDLFELLARQKEQPDNRIQTDELELVERSLAFTDKQAADVVRPRHEAPLVDANDTIGPILLDQLHKSGQSSFLVYKDKKENIIGSLSLRDAIAAKQGGRVFDLVRGDLTFVNEDFTLRQVFTALQKTDQYVAVVINKFEEFVGMITLSDLIKELLGDSEDEAVLHYDNRTEVAAYKPREHEVEGTEAEQPAEEELTSPDTTEVIE
jgi:CBS domain containing-hemolysin-like protein